MQKYYKFKELSESAKKFAIKQERKVLNKDREFWQLPKKCYIDDDYVICHIEAYEDEPRYIDEYTNVYAYDENGKVVKVERDE